MVAVGRELSPDSHILLLCVYRDKTQVWSWGLWGHNSHVLEGKVALVFVFVFLFLLCSLRQRRHRSAANLVCSRGEEVGSLEPGRQGGAEQAHKPSLTWELLPF